MTEFVLPTHGVQVGQGDERYQGANKRRTLLCLLAFVSPFVVGLWNSRQATVDQRNYPEQVPTLVEDEVQPPGYEHNPREGRNLVEPIFHEPLACNSDLASALCEPLSTWAGDVIPCGKCYTVDTTDGSLLEYPNGLRIEGKLYFPETANVVIKAKYVFVLGLLKIVPPASGNLVKFHLYQEDNVTFTASDPMAKCAGGCNVGSKVIAVLGGKLRFVGLVLLQAENLLEKTHHCLTCAKPLSFLRSSRYTGV